MVKEGWSGIDVQLKRRANLIPNLLKTVKGYMGHEQEMPKNVTRFRSQSAAATVAVVFESEALCTSTACA